MKSSKQLIILIVAAIVISILLPKLAYLGIGFIIGICLGYFDIPNKIITIFKNL